MTDFYWYYSDMPDLSSYNYHLTFDPLLLLSHPLCKDLILSFALPLKLTSLASYFFSILSLFSAAFFLQPNPSRNCGSDCIFPDFLQFYFMNLVLPGRTRPLHENFLPDSDLARVRLLIVEDDPFLQSYFSEILLECPLQVFIADSINEAVSFYLNKPPDILLMESYFSFVSVPSLGQVIQQRIASGSLHVITITDNIVDTRFSGSASFLTKPLVPGELTRVVMNLAENQVLKNILG